MATLYVTEISDLGAIAGGPAQIAKTPFVTVQTLTITNSSVSSAAFSARTRAIRVNADAVCSVAIAIAATATATSSRVSSDQTEYFGVTPGDQIAVITNS